MVASLAVGTAFFVDEHANTRPSPLHSTDRGPSLRVVERVERANWADELEALAHTPGGPDALALLVRYVATAADGLHLSQFHDILRGRAPAAESVTMTIAEQLRAEGRLEGRREGQSEGRREGALHGAATSLLTVLETRGIVVPAGARSRIEACQELDVLQHWLVRATTVATADEIFDT